MLISRDRLLNRLEPLFSAKAVQDDLFASYIAEQVKSDICSLPGITLDFVPCAECTAYYTLRNIMTGDLEGACSKGKLPRPLPCDYCNYGER